MDEKGLRLGEIALGSSAASVVRRFPVAPSSGWFGAADAAPVEGVLMYAGVPVEGDAPLAALLPPIAARLAARDPDWTAPDRVTLAPHPFAPAQTSVLRGLAPGRFVGTHSPGDFIGEAWGWARLPNPEGTIAFQITRNAAVGAFMAQYLGTVKRRVPWKGACPTEIADMLRQLRDEQVTTDAKRQRTASDLVIRDAPAADGGVQATWEVEELDADAPAPAAPPRLPPRPEPFGVPRLHGLVLERGRLDLHRHEKPESEVCAVPSLGLLLAELGDVAIVAW